MNIIRFTADEVRRWIKDLRISQPFFCANAGHHYYVKRFASQGSIVYEECWNTSKTLMPDPQEWESSWSFYPDDMTIADDVLYLADPVTEREIEAIEEAEAE